MQTSDGQVKVLDFGLAGPADRFATDRNPSTDSNAADEPPLHRTKADQLYWLPSVERMTEQGQLIGTPSHMSPEQARGEAATAASDMYSFGLLLQELFTGQSAYPTHLDHHLLLVKAAQADTLEPTGIDPQVGDLVAKLKDPNPLARPSAAEARESLRRIIQRPLRRRRQWLLASAVFLLVSAGLKYTFDLREERNRAVVARAEAEAAMGFLTEIFGASTPWDRKPDLSLKEVLDRGAERADLELRNQPAVRSRLQRALGNVYWSMGRQEKAAELLDKAYETQSKLFPGDSVEIAATLNELALVASSFEESEARYLRSLRILEGSSEPAPRELGAALHGLAGLYRYHGELAQALPLFERALALKDSETYPDPDQLSLAMTCFTFAELLLDLGELERAEGLLRRSLAIREKVLPPTSPRTMLTLKTLGRLAYLRGDLPQARDLWQRTLEAFESNLDFDHPEAIAVLNDLALAHMGLGKPDLAVPLYRKAVDAYGRTRGPEHRDTAIALNNLAGAMRFTGQFDQAAKLYDEALQIFRETVGSDNVLSGIVLFRSAQLEWTRGSVERAEALGRQSLAILEAGLGPDHVRVTDARLLLGRLALARGESEKAQELFQSALDDSTTRFERDPGRVNERVRQTKALLGLAKLAADRGDTERATARRMSALWAIEPLASQSKDVEMRNAYALSLLYLGRIDTARPVVEELLAFGWSDPELLRLARSHDLARP